MQDLTQLSSEARYLLSEINYRVKCSHTQSMTNVPGECPILTRLFDLAESLICLMDSCDFVVEDVYELRIDHETGELRDLPGLLRVTDEEIKRAEEKATVSEDGSEAAAEHASDEAP